MSDLLEVFSTIFQFLLFVFLATAVACLPLAVVLWSSEFYGRRKARRLKRRAAIPLTKIA